MRVEGEERERERKVENYPASLQSFVERRGGGEEGGLGWSEALPVEDKETGRDSNTALNRASKSSCNCFRWKSV